MNDCRRKQGSKVLIIGIDGATFKVIKPLVERKRLPNIARLMKEGVHGPLRSTIPVVSAVAWTSFATGKNPGKHGIYDFLSRDPLNYSVRVNNATMRKSTPLWVILSNKGRSVCVLNVTMTYPPDRVKGCMVSGLGTPDIKSNFTFPPSLIGDIRRDIGGYIITPEIDIKGSGNSKFEREKIIRDFCNAIENRLQVARYLMKNKDWDFAMVMFGETDYISHKFWESNYDEDGSFSDDGVVPFIYQKVDEAIGEILQEVDDRTDIIIMSDHGFQSVSRGVLMNRWLQQQGFLSINNKRSGVDFARYFKSFRGLIEGLLPWRFKKVADPSAIFSNVDWENTLAYSVGTTGDIYINLKGRETKGRVSPGKEYDDVCKEIIDALMKLCDPENGRQVISHVYKKEDIIHGDCFNDAPDLILEFSRGYRNIAKGLMGGNLHSGKEVVIKTWWMGDHDMDGILIMNGPNVRRGIEIGGANIVDVAPTALYLMGVNIPEDMDGKVLIPAIDRGYIRSCPVQYSKQEIINMNPEETGGYEIDEAQKVKERLRGLGYLE